MKIDVLKSSVDELQKRYIVQCYIFQEDQEKRHGKFDVFLKIKILVFASQKK